MFDRRQLLLALGLAACSPASDEVVTPLPLYVDAVAARVFVNEDGFEVIDEPNIPALTRGREGVVLTDAERAAVSNAISIGPMPSATTECAPTWRHIFVFYDAEEQPMGALAVCLDCMDLKIIGPAAPNPPISRYRYRSTGLRELVEARGLLTQSDITE